MRVKVEPAEEELASKLAVTEVGIQVVFQEGCSEVVEDICFIDNDRVIIPSGDENYTSLDVDECEELALWLLRRVKEFRAKSA